MNRRNPQPRAVNLVDLDFFDTDTEGPQIPLRKKAVQDMINKVQNSQNFPLRVDMVPHTRIGMTFGPGKKGLSPIGKTHDRDLDTDLDAIKAAGCTLLVSVMEHKELAHYHMQRIETACQKKGMKHLTVPVRDMSVPKNPHTFQQALNHAAKELRQGGTVVIHCLGGLGRTGMFAACLLQDTEGVTPEQSILVIRKARPGTIQTMAQQTYVQLHPIRQQV